LLQKEAGKHRRSEAFFRVVNEGQNPLLSHAEFEVTETLLEAALGDISGVDEGHERRRLGEDGVLGWCCCHSSFFPPPVYCPKWTVRDRLERDFPEFAKKCYSFSASKFNPKHVISRDRVVFLTLFCRRRVLASPSDS